MGVLSIFGSKQKKVSYFYHMNNRQILFLHIFYWLLNIAFSLVIPRFVEGAKSSVLSYTIFIVSFIVFYINYFFVVPIFFNPKKLYLSVVGYFISVTCFVLLRYFSEELVVKAIRGFGNYHPKTPFWFYFYDNIFYSTASIFFSTAICLFKQFSRSEDEKAKILNEKKTAEIQALKTQINPHFIFNSLNNIYSLVFQKSDKALPAIEELSELLRYSTKDLEQDFIPIKREIGYIESLIALEKLRIRNPEMIRLEKNIQNESLQISPMLLVPFVENAFKHGDYNSHEMKIEIQESQQILHFRIENEKRQGSKDHSSGIGVGNVKKRLDLIYPKKYELTISNEGNRFVVDLKIELD